MILHPAFSATVIYCSVSVVASISPFIKERYRAPDPAWGNCSRENGLVNRLLVDEYDLVAHGGDRGGPSRGPGHSAHSPDRDIPEGGDGLALRTASPLLWE